ARRSCPWAILRSRAWTSWTSPVTKRSSLADAVRPSNWTLVQLIRRHCPTDRAQYRRGVEGLSQVGGGAGLLDARAHRPIVVGRGGDDWNRERFLRVEVVHSFHIDVVHVSGIATRSVH